MIRPPFLQIGSKVALISPSGAVDSQWIEGATRILNEWGLQVVLGKHATGAHHRFSGTDQERISDLQWAINQPDIAAIICTRGGYGLARIVDKIDFMPLLTHPKWLLGFSDITVLHNALSAVGVESIHGGMCKHLCQDVLPTQQVKQILMGQNMPTYTVAPHKLNRTGCASGRLIGGNLSVLYGLRSTPYDMQAPGNILLIEDLCEPLYHIDRMMQNLRLSGLLSQLNGLIVGQFSDIPADSSFAQGAYGIIAEAVKEYTYPVCMNAPIGHSEPNFPLIIGANTTLNIQTENSLIAQ